MTENKKEYLQKGCGETTDTPQSFIQSALAAYQALRVMGTQTNKWTEDEDKDTIIRWVALGWREDPAKQFTNSRWVNVSVHYWVPSPYLSPSTTVALINPISIH